MYTQDFDNLELEAGVESDKVKQVHGNLKSSNECINNKCNVKIRYEEFKKELNSKLKGKILERVPMQKLWKCLSG